MFSDVENLAFSQILDSYAQLTNANVMSPKNPNINYGVPHVGDSTNTVAMSLSEISSNITR